ncbi:MAG: hypothetical protein JWR80_1270 [Bradyrhizobium sp.]|nr:hypothetical protein [Bradyrhizobium sp.]
MAQRTKHPIYRDNFPSCFDAYLRFAIATDFKDFEFFDDKDFKLFLLVELKDAKLLAPFQRAIGEFGAQFGPDVGETRYATLRCPRRAVVATETVEIWNDNVSRVELSLPLKPSQPEPSLRKLERFREGKEPTGSLLIGVLDDGCPFAAAHFLERLANGSISTRVLGIWDQNQRDPVEMISGRPFGRKLADFTYGLEYRRDFISPGAEIGIDEWINLHSTPAGIIDEDGCYRDAGFTRLSRRQSHGAHVMDVAAGRIPTASRVGPSPGDRRDPPSWKPGTDPASSADVVFVQFSDDCIRDATGVWLKNYVVDGILYILSFADPLITRKVVVNVSYGPTTGPHDGTAELESALTALVAEYDGTGGKPRLEIVLPAGNGYLSESHIAVTTRGKQPHNVDWIWRLPPDNAVLCFAEIWMDKTKASGVVVKLTSPGGVPYAPAGLQAPPPGSLPTSTGVYGPLTWGGDMMWLLAVEPTIARPGGVAEHGDWKVEVTGIGAPAQIDAYVARSDPNMGVRTGARRSYFVDPDWERSRSAEASCMYINGEFDNSGSLICRDGTLNGIGTGNVPCVHIAGGYILANGRKSPYSSAGSARDGLPTPRVGPDFALPCDESYALGGIRAGGNRSGSVFRLRGTSAAAPQLARHVAKPALPLPNNVPTPIEEVRKRGRGNLVPP